MIRNLKVPLSGTAGNTEGRRHRLNGLDAVRRYALLQVVKDTIGTYLKSGSLDQDPTPKTQSQDWLLGGLIPSTGYEPSRR